MHLAKASQPPRPFSVWVPNVKDEEKSDTGTVVADESPAGGRWIELFYDLFFAGSLSVFSRTREVARTRDLIDLAGFFTILWWTWSSQTFFDVRFARPGLAGTWLKFVQSFFFVMYGVFELKFTLFNYEHHGGGMESARKRASPRIAAIVIAGVFVTSRILLALQHLWVARRSKREHRKSLKILAGLQLFSGALWLASIPLSNRMTSSGFAAIRTALWYGGILIEAIGSLAVRATAHGFEHTHLNERYGALTTIIVGEGIIKLVSVLKDILEGVSMNAKSILAVASSVTSLVLVWALYFEGFEMHDKISKIRAYWWSYAHYFFHLSLVLLLDGIVSLVLFQNCYAGSQALLDSSREASVMADLFQVRPGNNTLTLGKLTFDYNTDTTHMYAAGTELTQSQYDYVYMQLFQRVFKSYGVRVSEGYMELLAELAPDEVSASTLERSLRMLLRQFFVSAQSALLASAAVLLFMIPIMIWQNRLQPGNFSRFFPTGSRGLIGAALLGFGIFVDAPGGAILGKLLTSGWLLPALTVVLAIIYLIDRLTWSVLQYLIF
ncbi:bacterial low temperature requirement A protein-domain-containing protein [Protomyces lactucae-debilis]|uniref:Bacterial low temperature requirement A protein-domain-containing protein n=1 Tax=Protomyces lactucae-debilis TaxID=2754530 RepID=A0A1Y2FIH9_PROLT|nr:bacterial low temperature requirement A protein-domain-containing protein [Protomyces lactucae-debilis]ORY82625.1 bacterial low temperature requirement A protein-domain-containing protein [Protomyces lactucae-debilis]